MNVINQVFDALINPRISTQTALAIIEWLQNEGYGEFYLTGSYYFDYATEKSDLDFFVTWTKEIEKTLLESGFTDLNEYSDKPEHYGDTGCIRILKYGNVQIQLVADAKKKNKIQQLMKQMLDTSQLSKDERKRLWNFAYQIIDINNQ